MDKAPLIHTRLGVLKAQRDSDYAYYQAEIGRLKVELKENEEQIAIDVSVVRKWKETATLARDQYTAAAERAEKAEVELAELKRRVLAIDTDSPDYWTASYRIGNLARQIREAK